MNHRSVRMTAGILLAMALMSGCAQENVGTPHPVDRLNYPVSVTAGPEGKVLWAVSGNFDLSYRGGAIVGIDPASHEFMADAAVEIGSYPGPITLFSSDDEGMSGYVLSRETDALYHLQMSPREGGGYDLDCGDGEILSSGIERCAGTNTFVSGTTEDDQGVETAVEVGPDPYGSLVRYGRDDANGYHEPDLLMTGAMVDGTVMTFELDPLTGAPSWGSTINLDQGLFAMAEHPGSGRIYTSGKVNNVFNVLEVQPSLVDATEDNKTNATLDLALVDIITIPVAGAGDDARGMAFSEDGSRLYVAYRTPHSLVVVNTGESLEGNPLDKVLTKIPVGSRPGDVIVAPATDDSPELVYVSCLNDDTIDVVDPALGMRIARIDTGRGPFGMTMIQNDTLRRLYVANFFSHSIGVIELDPQSPYYQTQIAEIR